MSTAADQANFPTMIIPRGTEIRVNTHGQLSIKTPGNLVIQNSGVYSEIVPFHRVEAALQRDGLRGIILSGGPASVTEAVSPRASPKIFALGVPVLGICYGEQAMCAALGGKV